MELHQILIVCVLALVAAVVVGVLGILIDKNAEPDDKQ
jgi:hypothetical protein